MKSELQVHLFYLIFQTKLFLDSANLQNFKEFIENKLIYVDKTAFLSDIIKWNGAFIINAERRTGKTLLLSTIRAVFEEKREWWESHGKNLKIWEMNPQLFDKNPYPVINFDFSQAANNEAFAERICEALNSTIIKYKLPLDQIEETVTLQQLVNVKFAKVLNSLIGMQAQEKPNGAVITIDESDQPLLNQMFDEELTKEQQEKGMNRTLKSFNLFYGYLKAKLASGQVRLVVVAGHSMIESLQSSLVNCL